MKINVGSGWTISILGECARKLLTLAAIVATATVATARLAYADTPDPQGDVAVHCSADLEDVAQFLPVNDSGASAALADHRAAIDAALTKARAAAAQVLDPKACDVLLQTYLKTWRPGHLFLAPWPDNIFSPPVAANSTAPTSLKSDSTEPKGDPFSPTLQVLDKATIVLTLPSFYPQYQSQLKALFKRRRSDLISHRNWIIDVRNNNGGSDDSWSPLLPWLSTGEMNFQTVEWYATPANARAQEDVCKLHPDPTACRKMMEPSVQSLRDAEPGTYVLRKGGHATEYVSQLKTEIHKPSRVAIMVDHPCGSSCDQFLLAARESYAVKLVGRPSQGMLDYSNLRPHALPSGRRAVYYAISRSTRLPAYPIDQIGVQPDVYLAPPTDEAGKQAEVQRVKRWLEGGSLKPD